jgi:hypothetical protein
MNPLNALASCAGNWRGTSWGWRIDVTPGGERLRVVMHNVWPEELGGKEELALEAEYARE